VTFALNPFRADPATPPANRWPAVVSIMAGIFAIVTAEILPIGLLLPIAAEFSVSPGVSGVMMTVPGLVAAVTAPLATVLTARADRRTMLMVWTALLAASNLICAVAGEFWMILAARVMVGVVIGGFWSIGAGLAGRLVETRHVSRATSTIFLAVPLGSVLGVPLGTFVADVAGWRAAFVGLTALSVAVLLALACTVPALATHEVTRVSVLGRLLRVRGVRVGLLITFLVVLAHFGTYTYVTAFLTEDTGIGLAAVSALLLLYGAAGLAGNAIAGATMGRSLRATFGCAAALIACATALLPVVGDHLAGAVVLLVLWGVGYGAVPACSQTWLARASNGADEAATVLFTSSFQATISIGALLGGVLVDGLSAAALMVAGGVVAGVAAIVVAVSAAVTRLDP
jgi:predicted MFS family arabinose efflux permease